MLLVSPTDVATGIGAKCGGSAPSADDAAMLSVLRYITPRVEAALEVATLTRGSYVDHFALAPMPRSDNPESIFLLSNGFIVPGTMVVTDPEGLVAAGENVTGFNNEYGTVRLNSWRRGVYSVAYQSGFEFEAPDPDSDADPESAVLQGVPDWIKGIVVHLMVLWFRTAQVQPRVVKDLSYGQVDSAIRRELYTRIYSRYMRPRVAVTFSERLDRVI